MAVNRTNRVAGFIDADVKSDASTGKTFSAPARRNNPELSARKQFDGASQQSSKSKAEFLVHR